MNGSEKLMYDNTPYITNKAYSIHLLSNIGGNQLLSKDSYLRSYLPKVKKVYIEKSSPRKDVEKDYQEENKSELFRDEYDYENQIKSIRSEESMQGLNEIDNKRNPSNPADDQLINKILNFFTKKNVPSTSKRRANKTLKKQSSEPKININSKLIPKISFSSLLEDSAKNQVDSNKRYNYAHIITNKRTNNHLKLKNDTSLNHQRLTYYNVPHISDLKKTNSQMDYRFTKYTNNIYKSIEFSQRNNATELNKFSSTNFLNKLCEDENDKMKKIISSQSNSTFLADSKLPKIGLLLNQPKTIVNSNKILYSKNFGEKYNPYCFSINRSKQSAERNPYGALFNN